MSTCYAYLGLCTMDSLFPTAIVGILGLHLLSDVSYVIMEFILFFAIERSQRLVACIS